MGFEKGAPAVTGSRVAGGWYACARHLAGSPSCKRVVGASQSVFRVQVVCSEFRQNDDQHSPRLPPGRAQEEDAPDQGGNGALQRRVRGVQQAAAGRSYAPRRSKRKTIKYQLKSNPADVKHSRLATFATPVKIDTRHNLKTRNASFSPEFYRNVSFKIDIHDLKLPYIGPVVWILRITGLPVFGDHLSNATTVNSGRA